jgi:hypothetical protein
MFFIIKYLLYEGIGVNKPIPFTEGGVMVTRSI